MRFCSQTNTVTVSSSYLGSFARTKSRSFSRLRFYPADARPQGERLEALLPLTAAEDAALAGSPSLEVEPDADVITSGGTPVIEAVRRSERLSRSLSPAFYPDFIAGAMLCGHILCKKRSLAGVKIFLTFESSTDSRTFSGEFDADMLSHIFEVFVERMRPFVKISAQREFKGKADIKKMPFPYPAVREGQRDMIELAYRAIKRSRRVLAVAPTGIGKTISALFPAVKALGDGACEKIFYLTAKNVTGNAALEAAAVMASRAPDLKAVMIIAKERVCPRFDKDSDFELERCSNKCPRLLEHDGVAYEQRRDDALLEILNFGAVYDTQTVCAAAKRHFLCPYELSLDLSEHCDIIVCDYNYAFDFRVRFRRYFVDKKYTYCLLVDEAHNLPDRAREMYSAEISAEMFLRLYDAVKEQFPLDKPLIDSACAVSRELDRIKALCLAEAELEDEVQTAYYKSAEIPAGLCDALARLCGVSAERLRRDIDSYEALLYEASSKARDFISAAQLFSPQHTFFAELCGDKLTVSVMCLEASAILDGIFKNAHGVVLFSATLTPLDYFADILGCREAEKIELDSPYDPGNLCIAVLDRISTRLRDRRDTAADIAEIIAQTVEAKAGNYLAYFPSYEHMARVAKAFHTMYPDVPAIIQKRGMSQRERRRFLERFSENAPDDTLAGFAVLGGMFSEGVDLAGEKLIGVIIVGTGLSGLSSRLNIIAEYYDSTRENGRDYAYTFPGMIKVQQAAGRVIRSESDCGVVVLVDDRFGERAMLELYPKHWRNMKFVGDAYSLSVLLDRFWNKEGFR